MGDEQIIDVLGLPKYNQLEKLQWKVKYLVSEIWKLDMEVKNKKSILTILDEIIGNLKYKSEERTREFYIKEGFRLVRSELGIGKQDNLNGDWKGIS